MLLLKELTTIGKEIKYSFVRSVVKIGILLIVLLLGKQLGAQLYEAYHISREDGLSNKTVRSVCVDQRGYVWIGTNFGLNRYDGYDVVSYYADLNDTETLSSNMVTRVYEDKSGRLWVETDDGINIYEPGRDKFKRIMYGFSPLRGRIVHENDSSVWILYNTDIYSFHKESGQILKSEIDLSETGLQKENLILTLFSPYNESSLILAVSTHGLFTLDKRTKTLRKLVDLEISNYAGLVVSGDDIWIASYFTGIRRLNLKKNELLHYDSQNSDLATNILLRLIQDPVSKNLWLLTDGKGIQVMNLDFEEINRISSGPEVNQPLNDNVILSLFFPKQDGVWVGTRNAGATYLTQPRIEHFPPLIGSRSGPSNGIIQGFCEDEAGRLWVATDGGGLNEFLRNSYDFEHYKEPGIEKITAIVLFDKNRLLVASYRDRLYFFDTSTKTFSNAHTHPLLQNVLPEQHYNLFKDSYQNIWIGSDKYLYRVNQTANQTEIVWISGEGGQNDLFPRFRDVFEDQRTEKLWFGTQGGFFAYSNLRKSLEEIIPLRNPRNNFGRGINAIVTDSVGDVILGTQTGLFKYSIESNLISTFLEDSGLVNTQVQELWQEKDELWVATNKGILTFRKDGALITQLGQMGFDVTPNTFTKLSDGRSYLGTNNGVIRFLSSDLKPDTLVKNVVLTSFSLSATGNRSPKTTNYLKPYLEKQKIKIPFSNSIYRFGFNSFDIPYHKEVQYTYTLVGFEEVWHTGNERLISYTNLDPGTYEFRVRASTPTGYMGEEYTSVEFEITPAWWQTMWFKILIVLLILTIAIVIWSESLKRAKLKHLVEFEKNEQERIKEVNLMKLRFFTNISHELRTPLTLIYSPLRKMLSKDTAERDILNAIPALYRNASRMKDLLDQILEFRKAEMEELKLNPGNINVLDTCREVVESFHYMAKTEDIKIELDHPNQEIVARIDKDKFIKIMYNLLSNALKYSPAGSKVILKLGLNEYKLEVSVIDSGRGIPDNVRGKIFERYYQVRNDDAGTGIGLALTKKLVDLHGGQIEVDSIQGMGAEFKIILPYDPNLKVESKEEKIKFKPASTERKKVRSTESHSTSILVIEDDWELRNYLVDELSSSYEVFEARNGRIGLLTAIEKMPDLIISDVMMPEMNGYAFCKALREDLRISHLPVILLTAKTMSENEIEGYKAGADLYVAKPFDKDILQSQIVALLGNRATLRDRFSFNKQIVPQEVTHSNVDEKLLQKAIGITEMNMQDPAFDVNSFVEKIGISRTLAYRKIKAISGKSINDFILTIRLQNAASMLEGTGKSVSEIALEVGFTDHSYFSAVFKRSYKVSPTEYRRNSRLK